MKVLKKIRLVVVVGSLLLLGGCVGSTTKITYINVEQDSGQDSVIEFGETDVNTSTDQQASGQMQVPGDLGAL